MAGVDAPFVPTKPRRASTAPLGPQGTAPERGGAGEAVDSGAPGDAGVAGAAGAAGAVGAAGTSGGGGGAPVSTTATAASAAEHTSPGDTGSTAGVSASGEAVETLYSHPAAKIISFTAGARSALDGLLDGTTTGGASASSSSGGHARGRSRRSLTASTDDDVEPGTLAWSSQFDRTIAVGALSIYRAPGSVAFLSCGAALQPILPKSQCWCIDEASSTFILQIRRPQYWRIEVPVGDPENAERALRLRAVLDHILQFEKTPCPFKRSFVVDLPEQPATPLKKKPWTPVKLPDNNTTSKGAVASPATTPSSQAKTRAQQQPPPQPPKQRSPSPATTPPEEASSTSPHEQPPPQQHEFTRREWLAMLESQKKGTATAEHEVDEFGRRIVPALIAEHEQRIMSVKASEIEVNKMGVPWRNNSVGGAAPADADPQRRRDRALSLASSEFSSTAALQSAADSSSSAFNSLRSWFSAAASSPPSSISTRSRTGSNPADATNVPPALAALFEDARRILANGAGFAIASENPQPPPQPRYRHRATTSSISVVSDHHASLPPAVNILTPYRHLQASSRATTRLEAMSRIPGSIINRVMEILLAPPRYLLLLMLRIAARIVSGEWRGFAVGKNTDTGETIPVRWDYTDVEDPLGLGTGISSSRNSSSTDLPRLRAFAQRRESRKQEAGTVDRLNVYTEADVEVYTDAEDNGDDDDDDDDDGGDDDGDETERCFSTSPTPRASAVSNEGDTPSEAECDPIVWTRRWAVD